jgi:peptide/nickel transport system permease protein
VSYRRYALERILASAGILFLAAALTYVLFHVIHEQPLPPARFDNAAQAFRYHRYRSESFGEFLWQFVGHGSLGRDLGSGVSLAPYVLREARVTLSLDGVAVAFALLVGVPVGLAWSYRPRWGRFLGWPFVHLALAIWPIWLGLVLTYVFSYQAGVLPFGRYCSLFSSTGGCDGPGDWLEHLTLPAIALGLVFAGVYAAVVRRLVLRVQAVQGTPEEVQAERHRARLEFARLVVRNVCWLIGATVFVESVFGLPGLGASFLTAVGDGPYAEAILMFATLLAVGILLAVDLVAAAFSRERRNLPAS